MTGTINYSMILRYTKPTNGGTHTYSLNSACLLYFFSYIYTYRLTKINACTYITCIYILYIYTSNVCVACLHSISAPRAQILIWMIWIYSNYLNLLVDIERAVVLCLVNIFCVCKFWLNVQNVCLPHYAHRETVFMSHLNMDNE